MKQNFLIPQNRVPLQHQGVFESVNEPIVIIENTGEVCDANPAADELFEVPRFNDLNFFSLFDENESRKLLNAVNLSIGEGREVRFKTCFRSNTGETLKLLLRARPWVDFSGPANRSGCALFIKDLTQQIKLTEAIKKFKMEAEAARIAKSQFLANISHEIKTPLNIVMGYAGLMKNNDFDEESKRELYEGIQSHGDSLKKLVEGLLEMSKVEANAVKTHEETFALYPLIEEVLSDARDLAMGKNIELGLEFKALKTQSLKTDPQKLKQILMNLLQNSVKFTDRGKILLKVYYSKDKRLAFKILDSGVGIPSGEWKRVFDPFSQADESMTRAHGGGGLGLAVSKGLAKALGGDLSLVNSVPGKGSIFELWLPERAVMAQTSQEKYPNLRRAKILLVEDIIENQTLIKLYLKSIDCDLDFAEDGLEALNKLKIKNYDLILMDLQMPRVDGFEATEKLRKAGIQTPVIALSAHNMKEDIERCKRVGFNDHLAKPVQSKDLLHKINYEIAQARI
ncbi:MAG: hypothetical protein CME64_12550 [Halobacteriovoraceae bacterium]|nr:hypothetical protein [Halobacteriovoraceae bacterium]|tara:strand:- start:184653 stop:186185 length:1533 start_codon:yes stop_codon:yes gene_type:complete